MVNHSEGRLQGVEQCGGRCIFNCTLKEGRRLEEGHMGKRTWRLEIVRGVGEGMGVASFGGCGGGNLRIDRTMFGK